MPRLHAFAFGIAAATLAGSTGADAQVDVDAEGCRVIRYTADGRRTETSPGGVRRGAPGAAAASVATGGASARSTVRASSSSRGGGTAVATATSIDAQGRTITTTHDQDGCTVTIDERTVQGGRP